MHGKSATFWNQQQPAIESMFLHGAAVQIDALERPEILQLLPSFEGLRVLDLGAGIGRFTEEFAAHARHVEALDFSSAFTECNRQRNAQYLNISYHAMHIMEAEFPPDSFDLIFANACLMYLEEPELKQLSARLRLWLKEGGHLFFRESCSAAGWVRDDHYRVHYRSLAAYHQLFDPLFTLVDAGSLQAFIDLFADPFKCYWLYQKKSGSST